MTRNYLINYNSLRRASDELRNEAHKLTEKLDSYPSAPIAKYGEKIGSSTPSGNAMEELVVKREAMREKAERYLDSANEIEHLLYRVDDAFKDLSPEESVALRVKYIDNRRNIEATAVLNCSKNSMYRRINSGVLKVATHLFGLKATANMMFV